MNNKYIIGFIVTIIVIIFILLSIINFFKTKNYIKNPCINYWYLRSDSDGKQSFYENGNYLFQEISPPSSVSKCNDDGLCENLNISSACYDNECIPYTNSEIYNNPCCSSDKMRQACDSWVSNNSNLNWLWDFCGKNKNNPLCQDITQKSISKYKDQLCSLYRSVCTGELSNREENDKNCFLRPVATPFDSEPFDQIKELFINTPYLYSKFKTKIKVKNLKNGSRGWGFWNTTMSTDMCFIWFMQQDGICPKLDSPNPICPEGQSYLLNGMYVMIFFINNGKPVSRFIKIQDLDEDWHTYEIDWKKDNIIFKVDDKQVYKETEFIPSERLSFHCWVDNSVFGPYHIVQKMVENRSQEIEWIKIWI